MCSKESNRGKVPEEGVQRKYSANPFAITPYRKQPQRRGCRTCQCQNPMNTAINGVTTVATVAVISGATLGVLGAFQK